MVRRVVLALLLGLATALLTLADARSFRRCTEIQAMPGFAGAHAPRVAMDEETRVGLTWQTGHGTNRTMVWHGGGTGGYRALVAFDPPQTDWNYRADKFR